MLITDILDGACLVLVGGAMATAKTTTLRAVRAADPGIVAYQGGIDLCETQIRGPDDLVRIQAMLAAGQRVVAEIHVRSLADIPHRIKCLSEGLPGAGAAVLAAVPTVAVVQDLLPRVVRVEGEPSRVLIQEAGRVNLAAGTVELVSEGLAGQVAALVAAGVVVDGHDAHRYQGA